MTSTPKHKSYLTKEDNIMSFINIKQSITDGIQDILKSDEFHKTISDVVKTSLTEVADSIGVDKIQDGVAKVVEEKKKQIADQEKNS